MFRIELELESDRPIENASTAQALSAFHRVGGRVEDSIFMIVFDTAEDSFLQILRSDDDAYHVEVQFGTIERQFQYQTTLTFGETALMLISYVERTFEFMPDHWKKCDY